MLIKHGFVQLDFCSLYLIHTAFVIFKDHASHKKISMAFHNLRELIMLTTQNEFSIMLI